MLVDQKTRTAEQIQWMIIEDAAYIGLINIIQIDGELSGQNRQNEPKFINLSAFFFFLK